MSWVELTLLSAFIWAALNVMDKWALSKQPLPPLVPTILLGAICLFLSILLFAVHGFPPLPAEQLIIGMIAGVLFLNGALFYFIAVQKDDISQLVPVLLLSPLFVVVLSALLLNENLNFTQYLGIALLILGAITISVKLPFRIIVNKAFWIMLLAAFFFASNRIANKHLANLHVDAVDNFSLMRLGAGLVAIPLLLVHWKLLSQNYQKNRFSFNVLTFNQLATLFPGFLLILAFESGPASLVSALGSIQSFFVLAMMVALSLFFPRFLKEAFTRETLALKILGILLLMIGGYLAVSG